MTQGEKIIELLGQLVHINSENANIQLDILDKLELIRKSNFNIQHNTISLNKDLHK